MAQAWEKSKKSGLKKLIFGGTVKVYVEKTWTFGGYGYYAQCHDETHFNLWLKHCHTPYSLKRGFGYHKKSLLTAVRLALKQLRENPDTSA